MVIVAKRAFLLALLALALAACLGGKVGTEPVERCVPEGACDEAMFQGGVRAEVGDITRGNTLFIARCASCHGPNGTGTKLTGSVDFTSSVWHARYQDAEIARIIRAGKPPSMPPNALKDGQLADLVAALRAMRAASAGKPSGRGY